MLALCGTVAKSKYWQAIKSHHTAEHNEHFNSLLLSSDTPQLAQTLCESCSSVLVAGATSSAVTSEEPVPAGFSVEGGSSMAVQYSALKIQKKSTNRFRINLRQESG